MRRIAKTYGGMRVSARGDTCDYVPKERNYKAVIRARERQGWTFYGVTPDDRFLQFTMPTEEVDKRRL